MYKLKYFDVKELVDQETYELLGENAIKLFNKDLLIAIDTLRETYGSPITINNWHRGGMFSQRGFRSSNSKVGSKTSQHRFGNAFDLTVTNATAGAIRTHILANKDKYPGINRMEDDVSWVHCDAHPDYKNKRIYLFKP